MIEIVALSASLLDDVVARVTAAQRRAAEANPMICPDLDVPLLTDSLTSSAADVVVAVREGKVVGHLRGTVLDSPVFGRSAWMGPEGVSYDDLEVLDHLYVARSDHWLANDVEFHYVWVPVGDQELPWFDLGFARMHRRGAMSLDGLSPRPLPSGYSLRRASLDDLETALALDDEMRESQAAGPSYALHVDYDGRRDDWIEGLEDPTTFHALIEFDGRVIAQCATYPLDVTTGVFPETIHLAAVTVVPDHRRLGVAAAMVDHVLSLASRDGFRFAETNFRVANHRATSYWMRYGFVPTYVRLRRHVGFG